MPMALQVKLLRVIQERKIRRLGGVTDIPVNARIISATNKDVETLVREGSFREDLYFRLNVFRLRMPPLRERRDDIPLLASHLLGKLSSRMGRKTLSLGDAALEKLIAWDFPGNVRELENILERAIIFCEGPVIGPGDIDIHMGRFQSTEGFFKRPPGSPGVNPLPAAAKTDAGLFSVESGAGKTADADENEAADTFFSVPGPEKIQREERSAEPPQTLEEIEKNAILSTLKRYGGNRTKAAEELGITRKTILNKLKGY
jgi:two-component system response regulator AtoC